MAHACGDTTLPKRYYCDGMNILHRYDSLETIQTAGITRVTRYSTLRGDDGIHTIAPVDSFLH